MGIKGIINYSKNQRVAMRADPLTNNLVVIQSAHNNVHEAEHFYCDSWRDVDFGTPYLILIKTATEGPLPHMLYFFHVGAEFLFEYFSDPIVTAEGTEIASWNNNEFFDYPPRTKFYENPVIADLGTVRNEFVVGSDEKKNSPGPGSDQRESEYIFPPDSYRLFRATKRNTGTAFFDFFFSWYEHPVFDSEATFDPIPQFPHH